MSDYFFFGFVGVAFVSILVFYKLSTRWHRTRDGLSVGDVNSRILNEMTRNNALVERAVENFDARLAAMEAKLDRLEQSRVAIAPPTVETASAQPPALAGPASEGLRPEELNAGNDD